MLWEDLAPMFRRLTHSLAAMLLISVLTPTRVGVRSSFVYRFSVFVCREIRLSIVLSCMTKPTRH